MRYWAQIINYSSIIGLGSAWNLIISTILYQLWNTINKENIIETWEHSNVDLTEMHYTIIGTYQKYFIHFEHFPIRFCLVRIYKFISSDLIFICLYVNFENKYSTLINLIFYSFFVNIRIIFRKRKVMDALNSQLKRKRWLMWQKKRNNHIQHRKHLYHNWNYSSSNPQLFRI